MRRVLAGFAKAMPPGVWPRYWDPAAVVGAVDAGFCNEWEFFSGVRLEMQTTPGAFFGQTQGLPSSSAEDISAKACVRSDYDQFVEKFWKPFGGRGLEASANHGLGLVVSANHTNFQHWI